MGLPAIGVRGGVVDRGVWPWLGLGGAHEGVESWGAGVSMAARHGQEAGGPRHDPAGCQTHQGK